MARGIVEEILYAFEDDNFIPECCEEEMEEIPEEHGAGFLTYRCVVCERARHFNAYTGADITEDF